MAVSCVMISKTVQQRHMGIATSAEVIGGVTSGHFESGAKDTRAVQTLSARLSVKQASNTWCGHNICVPDT